MLLPPAVQWCSPVQRSTHAEQWLPAGTEEEEESEELGCAEVVKDLVAGGKKLQQRRRETERLLRKAINCCSAAELQGLCAHVLV